MKPNYDKDTPFEIKAFEEIKATRKALEGILEEIKQRKKNEPKPKFLGYGKIRTLAITPTHRLIESIIYTPHTIITTTKWRKRRDAK